MPSITKQDLVLYEAIQILLLLGLDLQLADLALEALQVIVEHLDLVRELLLASFVRVVFVVESQ